MFEKIPNCVIRYIFEHSFTLDEEDVYDNDYQSIFPYQFPEKVNQYNFVLEFTYYGYRPFHEIIHYPEWFVGEVCKLRLVCKKFKHTVSNWFKSIIENNEVYKINKKAYESTLDVSKMLVNNDYNIILLGLRSNIMYNPFCN